MDNFIILHEGILNSAKLANPHHILIFLLLSVLLLSIYYLVKVPIGFTNKIFEWIFFGIMIVLFIYSL